MSADDRRPVPLEEALRRIGDGETVHTARSSPGVVIGADWPRAKVVAAIEKYGAEDSGPVSSRTGHTLVLFDDYGPLFLEAAPAESEASE